MLLVGSSGRLWFNQRIHPQGSKIGFLVGRLQRRNSGDFRAEEVAAFFGRGIGDQRSDAALGTLVVGG